MFASSKSPDWLLDVNITDLPPRSAWGHRCVTSAVAVSSLVSGAGEPPADGTWDNSLRGARAKKIVPSSAQLPPRVLPFAVQALQIVIGAPPLTEDLFRFPSAKNAIHFPSGEKNGLSAPSVPGSAISCNSSSFRT